MKGKNPIRKILLGSSVLITVLLVTCMVYVKDYYRADSSAIAAFSPSDSIQQVEQNNLLFFYPEKDTNTGLIFYPGGKVEHTAYIPLMQSLAQRGILCVLVEMPFHLAVLDSDAAEGISEQFPEIEHWYLSGHSLGGAMASSYLSEHSDNFQGLILLGAYSTADLSDSDLEVCSIYGSEDLVLNRDTYETNRSNLPETITETVLEGGCHAGFGMYGTQDGDGTPTLSNEEQITQTADLITDFVFQP